MEQEIINKAKKMLANADTGTNDCKNYNNGFMDGVKYVIKELCQPLVSGQSEQFYCNCSRAKGLDHDEDGMPYCIECQKPVQ